MDVFTAKNWNIGVAPRCIELYGDKRRKVEFAQHIIEFPGGAIEVSRTSDGFYWAHIIVNREHVVDGARGRVSSFGEIVGSRLVSTDQPGVRVLPFEASITQIAVLVKPVANIRSQP